MEVGPTAWVPSCHPSALHLKPVSVHASPQGPGRATTPTARALSTSASGTYCLAGSGALRTRPGSGSGPGPPRPALWAPTTCAKVGGLQQGRAVWLGLSSSQLWLFVTSRRRGAFTEDESHVRRNI